LKNRFSTAIKEVKPNRASDGVYFKIRKLKQKFPSQLIEKQNLFCIFQNREKKMKKKKK